MNQFKDKTAVVIGAGIAGPAMAMSLQHLGMTPIVLEAREEREMNRGVFLGLTPNGLNVLRDIIDPEELKEEFTPGKMCFYNAGNVKIGELDTLYQVEKYGSETIQIKRARISDLLRKEASGRGISIRYGKKLIDIQQKPSGILAKFADGSVEEADFLIACDGTHSTTRKIIFPEAPKPVYTGQISTGAFVKMEGMERHFGSIHMVFGREAFFAWAVSNKGEVWWFDNFYREKEPSREEITSKLQSEIRNYLLEIHKNDPEPIMKIIESTRSIFAYPIYEIPSLPRWYSDKVCLIGDAAHATAPHIGQGASLALEDTVVLAACLRDCQTFSEAFERFQGLRQPRVEKLIRAARKIGNKKAKPNRVATFFRDLLLKYFIKAEVKKMDWVYGYKQIVCPDQ